MFTASLQRNKGLIQSKLHYLSSTGHVSCLGWAHVVCALYIPEVEFANVSTMEPIVLQSVPHERYNKVSSLSTERHMLIAWISIGKQRLKLRAS